MEEHKEDQINQANLNTTNLNTNKVSAPFFQNPIIYVITGILLITGIAIFLLLPKAQPKQEEEQTIQYTTGLPIDHVGVQVNGLLRRYPLMDFNNGSINVNLNVFEGLTVYRGTNLVAGLAESWTNPDSTTWRIKLRKGVKFQSGDIFTAKDVKYTIEQAKASKDDKTPWVSQTMASRVDSVQIIDDYTVDLKTKEPDATLLSWLVYVGIVSKDQVARDGLAKAVGTGPYKFVSVADGEVRLEANDSYWGGIPKVKNLTYIDVDDGSKAKAALKNGTLDLITLGIMNNNDLAGKGYQDDVVRTGSIVYLSFDVNSDKSKHVNTSKNPFKDKRVRQAIMLTLDMSKIISADGINAQPVTQFATQELIGYNTNISRPGQNVIEAKKLITEAGFSNGFTVTIDVEKNTINMKTIQEMKKQLAGIGITLKPNFIETKDYYLMLDSGVDSAILETAYYPDTIDSLDFLDTLFHKHVGSHGYNNLNSYLNPQLNNILDQAISTFDVQKRIELTHQAHALVMEDLSSIPLYTEASTVFARDTIAYKPSISLLILGFDISGRQKTN